MNEKSIWRVSKEPEKRLNSKAMTQQQTGRWFLVTQHSEEPEVERNWRTPLPVRQARGKLPCVAAAAFCLYFIIHLYCAIANQLVFTFTSAASCSYLTTFSTHLRTSSPVALLYGRPMGF